MSEGAIFAAICVLAFGGWAFTLIGYTRASLAGANSVAVLNKVDSIIDERIGKLYDRIEAARARPMTTQPRAATPPPGMAVPPPDAASAMNRIFGGAPFVEEQPDASEGLPVVTA